MRATGKESEKSLSNCQKIEEYSQNESFSLKYPEISKES